ncbi:MAG: hypothetical protein M0Q42_08995 [Xanthomonadales bacterium]|nr:hypothetical protein [Xanthomonadales bacterium]
MNLPASLDLSPPLRHLLLAALAGLALAACGKGSDGDNAGAGTDVAAATAGQTDVATAAAAANTGPVSFQATVTGASQMGIEGSTALAGAAYGRYQLAFAGQGMAGEGPVLVSLARGDTSAPTAATYTLGDAGDFNGTVEIHPGPAEYLIDAGELVITDGRGDVLSGSFTLTAVELGGEASVTVNGRFHTRAAD